MSKDEESEYIKPVRIPKKHASIGVDSKRVHIGTFNELEDAVEARVKAKAKVHSFQPKDRRYDHYGKADEGLKPQHRPYVRCPTNLHNFLLDDDNV